VHLTGGSLRVFKQFARLEVDSVTMALSHPTHQRVTQAVDCNNICYMPKHQEIAKFSRIFDVSGQQKV